MNPFHGLYVVENIWTFTFLSLADKYTSILWGSIALPGLTISSDSIENKQMPKVCCWLLPVLYSTSQQPTTIVLSYPDSYLLFIMLLLFFLIVCLTNYLVPVRLNVYLACAWWCVWLNTVMPVCICMTNSSTMHHLFFKYYFWNTCKIVCIKAFTSETVNLPIHRSFIPRPVLPDLIY